MAAERVGRDPDGIALLPVTKMQDAATTAATLEAGITEIAENRVVDAVRKAEQMGDAAGRLDWQLIGHLQTNKVRKALHLFSGMHSLDSVRLAEALQKELARRAGDRDQDRRSGGSGSPVPDPGRPFRVYVEVNTSAESAKTGAGESEAREVFAALKDCPRLLPVGLMTMGPLDPDPETARPCFRRLRELLAELREGGLAPESCTGLSMGMSADFEVAVEEGSTVLRIGTAVFE